MPFPHEAAMAALGSIGAKKAYMEYLTMTRLWEETAVKCGVPNPPDVSPAPPWGLQAPNMGMASYFADEDAKNLTGVALVYGMGVCEMLSEHQICGAMAHELGHYVLGHYMTNLYKQTPAENHRLEDAADRFAAEHGYGHPLLSVLEEAQRMLQKSDYEMGSDGVHPPADVRRRSILNVIGEYEGKKKAA